MGFDALARNSICILYWFSMLRIRPCSSTHGADVLFQVQIGAEKLLGVIGFDMIRLLL